MYNRLMPGLIFGNVRVAHHCERAEMTLIPPKLTPLIPSSDEGFEASYILQGCVAVCQSACPQNCDMKRLAGLNNIKMQQIVSLMKAEA